MDSQNSVPAGTVAPTPTELRLLQIVTAALNRPVRPTDTWIELGVDSLGLAEMFSEVERRFNVKLDERVFEIASVSEMAAFLDCQQAA